eukprot:47381-Eustigmatos_ZCMA.PRE.1
MVFRGPFDQVAVDVVGPLTPTRGVGNKYIVVFTDYATRWAEAFPVKNKEATTIARLLVDEYVA